MKTAHSATVLTLACWLALVPVAATTDSTVTHNCLRIEDYNEPLDLIESDGVWSLVASTTRNERDHVRDQEVNYAWLDFSFVADRANFTHVIGFDGIIKSETREGLFVSHENGITSITSKSRHYNWTLYRMSNSSLLMMERIKYYKEGDVPIQLYASTCPQHSLKSIYPLNLTQIAGRWTLVAKSKSGNVISPLGKNNTSWIEFTSDGSKMAYEEQSNFRESVCSGFEEI